MEASEEICTLNSKELRVGKEKSGAVHQSWMYLSEWGHFKWTRYLLRFVYWKQLKITFKIGSTAWLTPSVPGRAFDPRLLLNNAVSNVICVLVFGNRFEYSDNDFQSLLKNINEALYLEAGICAQVNIFKFLYINFPPFHCSAASCSSFFSFITCPHGSCGECLDHTRKLLLCGRRWLTLFKRRWMHTE